MPVKACIDDGLDSLGFLCVSYLICCHHLKSLFFYIANLHFFGANKILEQCLFQFVGPLNGINYVLYIDIFTTCLPLKQN